jgi:hypothetical protein
MRPHAHLHHPRIQGEIRRALGSAAAYLAWLEATTRKPRRRGKGKDSGGVPVEPNRPSTLSGGAAAPLEFDPD